MAMQILSDQQLHNLQGGDMEIVIIYTKIDTYCGIQRIFADGELYSMRLICD